MDKKKVTNKSLLKLFDQVEKELEELYKYMDNISESEKEKVNQTKGEGR